MTGFCLGMYRLIDYKGLKAICPKVADEVLDVGGTIEVLDVNAFGSVLVWSGPGPKCCISMILSSFVKFFVPIEGAGVEAFVPRVPGSLNVNVEPYLQDKYVLNAA